MKYSKHPLAVMTRISLGAFFTIQCSQFSHRVHTSPTAAQSAEAHAVTKNQPTSQDAEVTSRFYTDTLQTMEQAGIDPEDLNCNNYVQWRPQLWQYSKKITKEIAATWGNKLNKEQIHQARRIALGYLVRSSFEHYLPNNLGAMPLTGVQGTKNPSGKAKPIVIFRSGVHVGAAKDNSCMQSLIEKAQVKHIINLYGGSFPFHDLIEQEEATAKKHGVSFHNEGKSGKPWRSTIEEHEDFEKNKETAMHTVAEIINTKILKPNGKPPEGNILLHCGGGMHRTGMIFGVLRKCLNQAPMKFLETEYKRHVDYQGDASPGGFEALNLKFISEFKCDLLSLSFDITQ